MDNVNYVYRNPRPLLKVESKGGAQLGHCYTASYYEVTSLHPLSMEDLNRIRESGFLGYGQSFTATQLIGAEKVRVPARFNPGKYVVGYKGPEDEQYPAASKTVPSGTDEVPCVMVDRRTNEVIPGEAINPYSRKPYGSTSMPYYVYECESRCDSGD